MSDELLEAIVLLLKLFEPAPFAQAQPAVLLLPIAQRRLRDACEMPILRQTSSARVPVSVYLTANAICSSVHLDFFTVHFLRLSA